MKQPHICLDETLGVRYAILPGDPARLDRVAAQLESVRELAYNREFRSLTGTYKGVPVLAVSTGIGGSSAGICVEELHNIGVEAAIRIGSCGALQKGIALGDLILGCGAIRDDGASKAYVHPEYPAVADYQLLGLVRGGREGARLPVSCRHHPQPRKLLSRGKRRGERLLVAQGRAGRGYGVRRAVYHRPSARDEDGFHSQ